jgi:O-antigen ligase/uncharacterized protein involved in exopolysaccharide biosynthesis
MAAILLVGFVLVSRWIGGQDDPRPLFFLAVVAAAHLALLACSLLWVDHPEKTLDLLEEALKGWFIALVFFGLLSKHERLRTAARAITLGMGAVAAVTCLQYLLGAYENSFFGFANASIRQIAGRTHGWRLSGPLPDPNFYAQALIIALPLAAATALRDTALLFRMAGIVASCMIVSAILLTYSRGGLAALVVVALAAAVLARAWRLLTAGAAGVLIVATLAGPTALGERLTPLIQAASMLGDRQPVIEDPSLSERIGLVRIAIRIFQDNPLLGVGLGQYQNAFPRYAFELGVDLGAPPQPHNRVLEILAETGLVGFAFLFVISSTAVIFAMRAAHRHGQDHASRFLFRALIVGFLGYWATALFLHDAFPRFYWLQLGMLMSSWWFLQKHHFQTPQGFMMTRSTNSSSDVYRAIRSHPLLIVSLFLLGLFGSGVYAFLGAKTYQAEASLFYRFGRDYNPVSPGEQHRTWAESIPITLEVALNTEIRLIQSRKVLETVAANWVRGSTPDPAGGGFLSLFRRMAGYMQDQAAGVREPDVVDELGVKVDELRNMLHVRRAAGSLVVTVAARHSDPSAAQQLVAAIVETYLVQRKEFFSADGPRFFREQIEHAEKRLREANAEMADMERGGTLDQVVEQRASVAARLSRSDSNAPPGSSAQDTTLPHRLYNDLARREGELRRLRLHVDASTDNLQLLLSAADRVAIDSAFVEVAMPRIEIVDPPRVGTQPLGLPASLRAVLGGLIGGIFGVALAFLLYWLGMKRGAYAARRVNTDE